MIHDPSHPVVHDSWSKSPVAHGSSSKSTRCPWFMAQVIPLPKIQICGPWFKIPINQLTLFFSCDAEGYYWWTSGSDERSEDRWFWSSTGKPFNYTNWYEYWPKGGVEKNFMQIRSWAGYKWYASHVNDRDFAICEYWTNLVTLQNDVRSGKWTSATFEIKQLLRNCVRSGLIVINDKDLCIWSFTWMKMTYMTFNLNVYDVNDH